MATYYVGSGGNDGNTGLSWAQRFLTLNGAEDEPVAANDTVYVAPGVYRELLTVDVSGGAGTEIVYIGDVTGEHTDSIGGIVRITGSDNDQTAARANCIVADTKDYRTFRGFSLDTQSASLVSLDDCTQFIIEDCSLQAVENSIVTAIHIFGASQAANTIRRCVFFANRARHINITHSGTLSDVGHAIENCLFLGTTTHASVNVERVGGITVRGCTFPACEYAVYVSIALAGGQLVNVNNCVIFANSIGLRATGVGEVVEDYNTLYGNSTDRLNVNVGGNSVAYAPLLEPPILLDGYKLPWWFGELSEWSQVAAIAGTSMSADDLLGMTRPTTDSKKSWGAVQWEGEDRDTGTTYDASTASLTLPDAGRVQFKIPTADSTEITISVRAYREANYAGTNPRLIVKQPGQADDTTTDAAAASQWNELTTTLTPADEPDYVIVELASLNTAAAGNYAAFFDALTVDSSPAVGGLDNWITDRIPFSDVQAAGGGGAVAAPILGPSAIAR